MGSRESQPAVWSAICGPPSQRSLITCLLRNSNQMLEAGVFNPLFRITQRGLKTKALALTFMNSDLIPLHKDPDTSEGLEVILVYSQS